MKGDRLHSILVIAFVVALVASRPAAAQDVKQPYPAMAPIEQYLMDRTAEIALARSAAPDAISHDASVVVLTRRGYETAVQGRNGWVCWVGRGWMAMFDHQEFWSPKVRAADCLNPPAARSLLPYAYKRTEMLLAGYSKQQVQSTKDGAAWGANLTNSPLMSVNYWYISPDAYPQLKSFPPLSVFMVLVNKWSDGTSVADTSAWMHEPKHQTLNIGAIDEQTR